MKAKEIIDQFGGQTALARLLGKGQSTTAYWAKTGTIPAQWHPVLMGIAANKGIPMKAEDFIAMPESDSMKVSKPTRGVPTLVEIEAARQSEFLFYAAKDGGVNIQVVLGDETVWASQKGMSEIFGVDVRTVSEHLQSIFKSSELDERSVLRNFRRTAADGKIYDTNFYSLNAIISVGYRVNSYQATQFRRWATTVLKEYFVRAD